MDVSKGGRKWRREEGRENCADCFLLLFVYSASKFNQPFKSLSLPLSRPPSPPLQ